MSDLEHYFENLLYHGEDIKGEANKNALTEEQQKAVEQCAQYVIYSLFETRERFDEWINSEPASSPWHRVEEPPTEAGEYIVAYHPCYWNNVDTKVTRVGIDNFRGKSAWAKKKYQRVTHWMEKPEPPKEDENGN